MKHLVPGAICSLYVSARAALIITVENLILPILKFASFSSAGLWSDFLIVNMMCLLSFPIEVYSLETHYF